MLLFICPLLIYLRISNKGGIGQFIAFVFLSLLTWGVAFPALLHYEGKVTYKLESKKENLTGGYFRECEDKVYYFTTDYNGNPYVDTTTVIIDKSENGTVEIEDLKYTPDFILYKSSAPYRDILIKNSFENNNNYKVDDPPKIAGRYTFYLFNKNNISEYVTKRNININIIAPPS